MKASNVNQPGERPHGIVRGHTGGGRAGSPGVTLVDAAGNKATANQWSVVGATVTPAASEAAVLTIGGPTAGTLPPVNEPIVASLSNPPTQAELQTAIGSAAGEVPGQSYVVTDNDTGLGYAVWSDGGAFVYVPIVQTDSDLVTLSALTGTTNGYHTQVQAAHYYNGKTYIAYLNSAGDVMVRSWTHATHTLSAATTLHAALAPGDSHGVPVLIVRPSDHKIVAIYCAHNGANMYQRISSSAENISAFAAETDLDSSLGGVAYTYPQLHAIGSTLYLFYRRQTGGVDTKWAFSTSTDGGATWAAETILATEPSHWSYLMVSQTSETRLDVSFINRSTFDEAGGSVYHFWIESGNYYKTDGTEITAALPLDSSDMTLVWASDGTQRGIYGPMALGPDGRPRMAFAEYETISPEDCRYLYGAWAGTTWEVNEIAAAGASAQTANIALEPGAPNTVWYSKVVGATTQMMRAVTADEGATWTEQQITEGTDQNGLINPIRDAAPDLKMYWQSLAGGWTRNDTVNANLLGAGFVGSTDVGGLQRVVALEEATGNLVEITFRIGADGSLDVSDDGGDTYDGAGGSAHIHIVGEPFVGDGAQTVYYLAQEAELDTVAAYTGAGARVAITQDTTDLDKITFSVAPAAGTGFIDYVPATN